MLGIALSEDSVSRAVAAEFDRALRRSGLSNKAAALLMQVPEQHVSEMTKGERNIPAGKLIYLGFAFAAEFLPLWMALAARNLTTVYQQERA